MPTLKPHRILLAVDGSAHARRAAQYVARRAFRLRESEVVVAHVLEGPPRPDAAPFDPDPAIVALRGEMQAAGAPTSVCVTAGSAVERILEFARREACDEIVMGSRGAGTVEGLVLGSVAYKVAHLAGVPVTIVPNPYGAAELDLEDGGTVHRILLAVDGSKAGLRAVEHVCELHDAAMPVEVHVLNVQLPLVSGRISRYVSSETIDGFLREEGRQAIAAAAEALRESGMDFHPLVRIGRAAESIVAHAQQVGCTRIVMGSRGLGAFAGALLGSTALQVLHLSELPVTLVK
jgi:nucleotide-binding universal stress UspA family protein